MSTNVYESTVVCAPVDAVWQLVRNCDFRFLNAVESAVLESGSAWTEVGSIRCITYADKNRSRRWYAVDEISDVNHQITYSMVKAEPEVPVQAAVHTIRLRRVTKPVCSTFIQFVTEFSRDVTEAVLEESRAHKAAFFAGVNRALRQDFAKDQREQEHHTPLQRLLEAKSGKPLTRAAECRGPQAQREIPTSAAPTFAASEQVAGKREPKPSGVGGWKPAPPMSATSGPFGRDVQIGRAEEQTRVSQEGMKKACCGCSLPCNCLCCSGKAKESTQSTGQQIGAQRQAQGQGQSQGQSQGQGQGQGQVKAKGQGQSQTQSPSAASKPAMLKATAASQYVPGKARDIPIHADEKRPLFGAQSPSQRGASRGFSRRRMWSSPKEAPRVECHPAAFSKAAELLEHADFTALKSMTAKEVDELWQSLPKESHGALRVEDAEDFVDVLMDRLSEEDNDMVHFVAKMLQEPGSPPSFAAAEDFTPQLRQELKRWKRGAAKKLTGKLDRNRDKLIGKDEFNVLFSDWFSKQVYEELRASFFG